MPRPGLAAVAVLTLSVGCAAPTPEQQIVDDAASALGGRERLLAIRTLVFEGEGTQYNLGQDVSPDARGQTFSVAGYRRQIDVAGGRARVELTRTPGFPYFQGQAPQRLVQGIDGAVGYNVAPNGTATRVGDAAAADRRAEIYHHPLTAVRAALAPGAVLANARTEGERRMVDVTTDGGVQFVLVADADGLPAEVQSKSYHANLGDVILSTTFAGYQDASGLRVPGEIATRIDDFTTAELRLPRHTVDGTIDDLGAPSAAASASAPAPPAPNVVPEQVAPGIWLLAGQSHHSALVELSDHLMLIEAPQSEARTLAVIAKARELRPGKPLRTIVTTHHHFDHTAGIRAAISEGLTVVTHAGNRQFFEDMAARPHTIVLDALARNPRPLTVETVDDELIMKDAARTVALYHVAGNPHSETMLMAYFPAERVLVEVDVFTLGAAVHPYAANLLRNITSRKLRVDRIIALHGAIAPFSELVKAGGATTN
jgi:glyoxylase-like metal-dependent hydrolase (beta-lactamase superfamily II)